MNLKELQQLIRGVDKTRFPDAPSYLALIKVQEELGELADAYIAGYETRVGKESKRNMGEEAADVIISLITFCEREGIDIESAILEKWDIVSKRTYTLVENMDDSEDEPEHCEACGRELNTYDSGQACPSCCEHEYICGTEQCDFCPHSDECMKLTYGGNNEQR